MNKQKGFTLVEVMVAVAILGAVSLGVAELFKNLSKNQAMASSYSNFENMKSSIRLVINNSKICKGAILNSSGTAQVYNPTSQTFVQNFDQLKTGPNEIVKVNSTLYGIKVNSLTLKPFGNWPSTPYQESVLQDDVIKNLNKHYTTLEIKTVDTNGKVRNGKFDMVVLTDPISNVIEQCYVAKNEELRPNITFQMGDKSDGNTTKWYCRLDMDLMEYCGDEDGCRVTGRFTVKTAYYDRTLSMSYVIYMEQPTLSNNLFEGVYGSTMEGATYTSTDWISGSASQPYYNLMKPWGIFYMMTYNWGGGACVSGASEPLSAYHFSFALHPSWTGIINIQDNPFP
jgi:prepilin-type N-terminal cleavage/methylation domain-containing protein